MARILVLVLIVVVAVAGCATREVDGTAPAVDGATVGGYLDDPARAEARGLSREAKIALGVGAGALVAVVLYATIVAVGTASLLASG